MRRTSMLRVFCIVCSSLLVLGCQKDRFLDVEDTGAPALFEEAWRLIDERYALFAEKGIDWDSVRLVYERRFVAGMAEREMFAEMSKMLETLKDGHVVLISPFDTSAYDGFYRAFPANFNLEHVLENYLGGDYQRLGPVIYAVRERVGYIYYGEFARALEEGQLDSLSGIMAGTRGLVIDVRGNQGGSLLAAERLASILTANPLLVKFEQYKTGVARNAFGQPVPLSITPFRSRYDGAVIVLTNRSCFSACNDFVLYTSAMTSVRRYGDRTGGGGGIPSAYRLSNGWTIQFSATKTLSAQLVPVEQGIEPDRNIQITVLDDARGRDPILEAAFLDLR